MCKQLNYTSDFDTGNYYARINVYEMKWTYEGLK